MEDLIRSHEGVTDVAVIGVDDVKYGQVPKAFVVPKGECPDNQELTEQDVHDFVNQRVTDFKRLRGGKKVTFYNKCKMSYHKTIVFIGVEFVESIPKNASGKILRRELREKNAQNAIQPNSRNKFGKNL